MLADESRLSALEERIAALEAAAQPAVLAFGLPYDGLLSFATKCLRMFNYGAIAPVFFLYCLKIGLDELHTGALLTCILLGDLAITLYLSTRADAFGRRNTLIIGSLLKVLAGAAFASSTNFYVLTAAGIVGVISTSGGEIGPFMAIEQAALTDACIESRGGAASEVAILFGWYNFCGYIAQALGALASGLAVSLLQADAVGWSTLASYKAVFVAYGVIGGVMALCYATLSRHAEARPKPRASAAPAAADAPRPCCPAALSPFLPRVSLGLRRAESKYIVARLSLMFAMDAFAGAFVLQTWIAFWFSETWAFDSALLGYLLMGANVVAGLSGIAAAYFVRRFGAMLTMIASHLPSNVLLLAVPLMPSGATAAAMLVARFTISQMDVPARQAYVTMVVASDERSAAGGITNIVRSLGMSFAPLLLGYLSSAPRGSALFNSPWLIAGAVKIAYDIILYTLYRCDGTMASGEAVAAQHRAADKLAAAAPAAAPRAVDDAAGEIAQPLLADDDDNHDADDGAAAAAAAAAAARKQLPLRSGIN